jgi:hypothetical protein
MEGGGRAGERLQLEARLMRAADSLTTGEPMSDFPVNQRRVSAAVTGITKPTGAASSVFDVAKASKPSTPPFNPEHVVIRQGVPIPSGAGGRRASDKYGPLLQQMKAGDMVELATKHALAMVARAKKLEIKVLRRQLSPGRSGVWRIE